jgi:hypothetical protein
MNGEFYIRLRLAELPKFMVMAVIGAVKLEPTIELFKNPAIAIYGMTAPNGGSNNGTEGGSLEDDKRNYVSNSGGIHSDIHDIKKPKKGKEVGGE